MPKQNNSKVDRKIAQFILQKFIKKDIWAQNEKNYKFFSREIKMIGDIYSDYPNEDFWKILNFGYELNSFAFLKSPRGKQLLHDQWILFQRTNNSLDKEDKKLKIDLDSIPDSETLKSLGENFSKEKKDKNQELFDWLSF